MAPADLIANPSTDISIEKSGPVASTLVLESGNSSPVLNGREPTDGYLSDNLSSAMARASLSSSPPHPVNDDDIDYDDVSDTEHEAFSEAVKREISYALSGNTRAHKAHIKFSSAETEANTNANSYFGPANPATPPGSDSNKHLSVGSPDTSDFEDSHHLGPTARRTSRSRTPGAANRRSRSRSRGSYGNAHAGVKGHFVDPNSPSAAFEHRVAFDTFDNKNATDFSLTLQSKHEEYQYSRLSRTFLCGTDKNKYSENAVTWLLEELAEDGDEIVCLRVIDPNSKISSSDKSLEEKRYRDEAHSFLEHIMTKNKFNKKISLVLEFAVGSVESLIKRMIQIYEPSILIVGTRGRSIEGFKGLLPGSVSKWCLQHSPIPVVVVKPIRKREGQKAKREANPNKLAYLDMIASHPDETPKIYKLNSSSDLLAPQIPAFLHRNTASDSAPALTVTSHSRPTLLEPEQRGERLGRFDRLRSRSRSPLPSPRR